MQRKTELLPCIDKIVRTEPRYPLLRFKGSHIAVFLVQKETGGNLAEILEKISIVIRGRFRLARKVQTYSAEGRMSAWVLAMVPLVLFVTLWITTPEYLPVLLDDPRGQKMIMYGFVSGVVGIFWIKRIIRIEV